MFKKLFTTIIGGFKEKAKTREGLWDYDSEVYQEMVRKYGVQSGKLTEDEKEQIDKILSISDARPGDFDGTLEAWLFRISLWGKINIRHRNPEDGIDKILTNDQFLDYIDDKTRNATRGLWGIRYDVINEVVFYRTFWSILGKEVTEELIVTIKLNSRLKKIINKTRKDKGLFGKLGF